MLEAAEAFPMNLGFMEREMHPTQMLCASRFMPVQWVSSFMKTGEPRRAIDHCLSVADELDIQVAIHTDTLNESGFVETTIAAFKDRVIHTFHSEGAGGGHAPDIMKVCSLPNVLPSSTNPT